MEKGSSSSANKKGKKKVPKREAKPKQQQKQQKPRAGNGKPKGKCYTCGQKGHYRNNCPKKPQSQNNNNSGMPQSYVVETYFMARTTSTWCVDTGATNYVCNSLQGFQEIRQLAKGEIYLLMRVLGKKTASHALLSLCMVQSFDTLIKYHFPP